MQIQKRTDTAFGNPVMGRREMTLRQQSHRERVHGAKSMIDTSAPTSQPHLTLYGRDYAAKKKATTEAAFMDLKMIQSIARTMTRKTEVEQRKGPVSLNADGRKAEIYRVMHENHRLLDAIENVSPMMRTADLIHEHKEKTRYVINSSHTMRLSGEYDMEMARIKREDGARFHMKKQSTESRMMAAKMRNTTGSVSLPSLTGPTKSESQLATMSHGASAPLKEKGPTSQMSQSRSAGGLAGATKAAKAAAMNAQGEMRPSPGPPPQRNEYRDASDGIGTEPDQEVAASRSAGSKESPSKSSSKSAPKRVSKKQPEPEAAAATSPPGKRSSVSFTAHDDVEEIEGQALPENPRRMSRMGTPHPSQIAMIHQDEEEEEEDEVDAELTEANAQEADAAAVDDGAQQAAADEAAAEPLREEQVEQPDEELKEMTAQEIEVHSSQLPEEEVPIDDATFVDEAIIAVEQAENSVGLEEVEVLGNLSSALSGKKLSERIRKVLAANGWNGSSFDGKPDLPQLLRDLRTTKEEIAKESNVVDTSGVPTEAPGADTQGAHVEETADDEYEDEFIDASADSLNMSRTLKSHDAPQEEAFESATTFEDHDQAETGDVG